MDKRYLKGISAVTGGMMLKDLSTAEQTTFNDRVASGEKGISLRDGYLHLTDENGVQQLLAGGGTRERVVQPGHGLTPGKPVYHNGASYQLTNPAYESSAEAIGIVSDVIDTDTFVVTFSGKIVIDTMEWTPGAVYYLGEGGNGLLSTDKPSSGYVIKPMLFALTETSGIVLNYLGMILTVTNFHTTGLGAEETVVVDSVDTADCFGVVWQYAVRHLSTNAVRSGQFIASFESGTQAIEFSEEGTMPIGDTTAITFGADYVAGTIRIKAINGGLLNNWEVKVKRHII